MARAAFAGPSRLGGSQGAPNGQAMLLHCRAEVWATHQERVDVGVHLLLEEAALQRAPHRVLIQAQKLREVVRLGPHGGLKFAAASQRRAVVPGAGPTIC